MKHLTAKLALFLSLFTIAAWGAGLNNSWTSICYETAYQTTTASSWCTYAQAQRGIIARADLDASAATTPFTIFDYNGDNQVKLSTTAEGKYNLIAMNGNTQKFNVTNDTVPVTAGRHLFATLIRRGISGGNGHVISILVYMDGQEIFKVGDGSTACGTGPYRQIYFGTSGATSRVTGAIWTNSEGCGTADTDEAKAAKIVEDANTLFGSNVLHMPYRLSFDTLGTSGIALQNDSTDFLVGSITPTKWKGGNWINYNGDCKTSPYAHQTHGGSIGLTNTVDKTLASGNEDYTVGFWFKKVGDVTIWRDILGLKIGGKHYTLQRGEANGYYLYPYTSGSTYGTAIASFTISDETGWSHLLLSFSTSGALKIYCGQELKVNNAAAGITGDLQEVLLGGSKDADGNAVSGRYCGQNINFDELAIYTGTGTDTQMKWLAAQDKAYVPSVVRKAEVTDVAGGTALEKLEWKDEYDVATTYDANYPMELTGSGLVTSDYAFETTITLGSGVTFKPTSVATSAVVKGAGTIVYGKEPGTEKSNYTSSTWTGTVWIKGTAIDIKDFNFDNYGRAGSKVKLTGVTGYGASTAVTNFTEVVLADDGMIKALTLNNGYSGSNYLFKKLSGSGTFTTTSGTSQAYRCEDLSDFTGTINIPSSGGMIFVAGNSTHTKNETVGRILVDSGFTATIPSGITWTARNGFEVSGTLNLNGTASGTIKGDGTVVYDGAIPGTEKSNYTANTWTGTVWLKNITSGEITPSYFGNASSTVKYTNVAGHFFAFTYGGTVELDNGGGDFALTIKDGTTSDTTSRKIETLTGTGKLILNWNKNNYIPVQVVHAESFAGEIQVAANNVYCVCIGDSTTDAARGKIVVEAGAAASAKTVTAASGVIVNGSLTLASTLSTAPTTTLTDYVIRTYNVNSKVTYRAMPTAIVVTEDTTLEDFGTYYLGAQNSTAEPITITGGTLNLNNVYTWSATDGSGWLTQKAITLGGTSATKIEGGNVTFYSANISDAIIYRGGDGANAPAEFAANWHSSYSNQSFSRNILVEKGAGENYDLLISGTIGLSNGQFNGTTIHKTGAGAVLMTGAFNFPVLAIDAGTWKMGGTGTIAASTTVGADGTLDVNGNSVTLSGLTLNGTLANSAAATVTITSDGTSTVDLSSAKAITGNFSFTFDISTAIPGVQPFKFADAALYKQVVVTGTSTGFRYNTETGKVEAKATLSDKLIWLPVGDSITEGEQYMGHPGQGTIETRGGYRYQLWSQLVEAGQLTRSVGYRNGHQGTVEDPATCDWAWHAAQYGGVIMHDNNGSHGAAGFDVENTLALVGYPDIITVLIGVNDLSFTNGGDNPVSWVFSTWKNMIVKYATERPQSKVVVSTLLPAGGSRGYITTFNTLIRNAATAKSAPFDQPNVVFADVNNLAFGGTFNSAYFKSDSLHPNETGAKKVAAAFASVIEPIIAEKAQATAAIVSVDNAATGKLRVRFTKALKSVTSAKLTLEGTDVNGQAVSMVLDDYAIETDDARLLSFDYDYANEALIGGDYTVSLALAGTDGNGVALPDTLELTDNRFIEIEGTGAAENVPSDYRDGFVKYGTISPDAGTATSMALEEGVSGKVKRIGYYAELKRPGAAPQYVWASMDATAFGNSLANAGLPTSGSSNIKALVENLQVYGKRGNFENTTSATGVVEITAYDWTTTEQADYPTEFNSNCYGWNDTLGTSTLKGGIQVARVFRAGTDCDNYTKVGAETLFALNNFNSATATDFGIGSFSTHRNNAGGTVTPVLDWTDFVSKTGYTKFALDAYETATIEVWVELEASPTVKPGEGGTEVIDNGDGTVTITNATSSASITIETGFTGTIYVKGAIDALTIDGTPAEGQIVVVGQNGIDITAKCFMTRNGNVLNVALDNANGSLTPAIQAEDATTSTKTDPAAGKVVTSAIPGLTYTLKRGTEVTARNDSVATHTAGESENTVTLEDRTEKPKSHAFYSVEVTK